MDRRPPPRRGGRSGAVVRQKPAEEDHSSDSSLDEAADESDSSEEEHAQNKNLQPQKQGRSPRRPTDLRSVDKPAPVEEDRDSSDSDFDSSEEESRPAKKRPRRRPRVSKRRAARRRAAGPVEKRPLLGDTTRSVEDIAAAERDSSSDEVVDSSPPSSEESQISENNAKQQKTRGRQKATLQDRPVEDSAGRNVERPLDVDDNHSSSDVVEDTSPLSQTSSSENAKQHRGRGRERKQPSLDHAEDDYSSEEEEVDERSSSEDDDSSEDAPTSSALPFGGPGKKQRHQHLQVGPLAGRTSL